jgi:hypothetical protein
MNIQAMDPCSLAPRVRKATLHDLDEYLLFAAEDSYLSNIFSVESQIGQYSLVRFNVSEPTCESSPLIYCAVLICARPSMLSISTTTKHFDKRLGNSVHFLTLQGLKLHCQICLLGSRTNPVASVLTLLFYVRSHTPFPKLQRAPQASSTSTSITIHT